jgi:tetratricopeptide (TPR) repeat protein
MSKKTTPALLTALFFGIHPMFVESTAWISERKDVLYAFFFLLSLIFYLDYVKKKDNIYLLSLSFLMFVCSVLSKSTALLLPIILLLIDWYLNRTFRLKLLFEKLPFFIVSVLITIVALKSQYSASFIDFTAYQYSIFDKPFLAAWSLLFYIYKFFIPVKLSVIHPYPEKSGFFLPSEYYIAFLALIVLIYALYRIINSRNDETKKQLIFGVLFFVIMLSLFIHIVALPGFSVAAERYAYIPYIGLFFIFSSLTSNFWTNAKSGKNLKKYLLVIFISVMIVFFSISTYSRNKTWKSNFSIFSDAIHKYPDVPMPYNNRGLAYSQAGNIEKAISDFTKAVELKPNIPTYHYNLGNAYLSVQNYPMSIKSFSTTITLKKGNAEAAYINRGIAYQKSGYYIASYWDLTAAINLQGQFASIAYFNRGATRMIMNDKDGACSDWQSSLKLGYREAEEQINKHCR